MRKRLVVAFASILVLCIALMGCSGGSATGTSGDEDTSTTSEAAATDSGLIGCWQIVSADQSDETWLGDDELGTLRSLGFDSYIQFSDDGECEWHFFGDTFEGTADVTDATRAETTLTDESDDTNSFDASFWLDGDELTADKLFVEVGGIVYTYARVDGLGTWDGSKQVRDAYLTDDWFVNGNALIDLSGEELYWLLWTQDYHRDNRDEKWIHDEPGHAILSVIGPGEAYIYQDTVRGLQPGGEGSPVIFVLAVNGFGSAEDTFAACFGKSATEYASTEDIFVTTVSSSTGAEYLVLLNKNSDSGGFGVWIAGEDGIGVLEGYLGDELGSSIPEAYENLAEYISTL